MGTFILFVFLGMILAWNVFTRQPKWCKWLFDKCIKQWFDKAMAWLRSI